MREIEGGFFLEEVEEAEGDDGGEIKEEAEEAEGDGGLR